MSYHVLDHISGMWVHPGNILDPEEPFAFPEIEDAEKAIQQIADANKLTSYDDFEIIDQEEE